MKKVLTLSLLALFVSHGALATNYVLNNDNIALSFDDANSTVVVKDNKANHPLTPQELFFLTLPDETKIHTADFTIKHVEKQDNAIVVDFTHPDFNVTVKLNLVKGKYSSIDYTVAAVSQPRDVAKITFFPTKKQSQAPYVDGAINSSPIVADSFFILPDKPIVNTYAYEATTNLNVELKTPIQPESPVSFTTWFGSFPEISQLRRSVNQFIDAVRPRPYKPY
ncbi:MAG: enterotoxin, partial [Enterobacter hormaechei]